MISIVPFYPGGTARQHRRERAGSGFRNRRGRCVGRFGTPGCWLSGGM